MGLWERSEPPSPGNREGIEFASKSVWVAAVIEESEPVRMVRMVIHTPLESRRRESDL